MTTTALPDLKPDRSENDDWRRLDLEPAESAEEHPGPDSLDPTQGRKLGSNPYEDPTQGRKLGSNPYDDPTQGRKLGSNPYDDPTRARLPGRGSR